jgi:antibiotic biosynthesis monooxygenase (ABM) superfamily enzyme
VSENDQPPSTTTPPAPATGSPVEPVSTRISRTVPADKVVEFDALLHEVITAARGFEGHLGVDVLRPEGGGTYQIIFRYRGRAEHEAWMGSEQRRRLVGRIDDLLDDATEATVRTVDGWEGWFVAPGYAPPVPPRRWKMAVITWGALYPTLLILITALLPVTGGWPLPVALLLTTGLSVPLMTWVVMPALTRRLGSWLRR